MSTIAVGTEYHAVISFSRMRSTMRGPETTIASSTTTIVAPRESDDQMSKTERSKWNGATLATRSFALNWIRSAAQSTNASAFRCESITPLGMPVEPDV